MDLVAIGARIQEKRNDKGLNAEEFAEILGVSTTTVGNIERGVKGTRLINFYNICVALETSADYLLFGK